MHAQTLNINSTDAALKSYMLTKFLMLLHIDNNKIFRKHITIMLKLARYSTYLTLCRFNYF